MACYAGTDNSVIAERVIKACLLQPADPELMRALSRLSEVAEQSQAASVQLLLTLAHARLEQQVNANTELAAGKEILINHFPAGEVISQRWESFWFDWLIAQIHLRE